MRAVLGIVCVLGLCGLPATAQQTPAKPAPVETAPPIDATPPYEPQLLRLAQMMGALAFLRDLCGDGDGRTFHDKMTALLEAEARSQSRKETLAGAYNRSFRDYEIAYRACTPAARELVARFLAETARLTADLANRYGG